MLLWYVLYDWVFIIYIVSLCIEIVHRKLGYDIIIFCRRSTEEDRTNAAAFYVPVRAVLAMAAFDVYLPII